MYGLRFRGCVERARRRARRRGREDRAARLLEEARAAARVALALHTLDVLGRDEVEGLPGQRDGSGVRLRGRGREERSGRTSRKRSVQRMRQASSFGVSEPEGLTIQALKLCEGSDRVSVRVRVQEAAGGGDAPLLVHLLLEGKGAGSAVLPRRRRRGEGTHVDELLCVCERCRGREAGSAVLTTTERRTRERGDAPSCCSTSCLIWAAFWRASSAERVGRAPKRDDMLRVVDEARLEEDEVVGSRAGQGGEIGVGGNARGQ